MPEEYVSPADQTTRGQVMHDLGELAEQIEQGRIDRTRPPTRADAERFVRARTQGRVISEDQIARLTQIAIQDWRATQRAKSMRGEQDITDILGRVVSADQTIGVRVVVKLDFPNGRPPGVRDTVSILIDVLPRATKDQIINAAVSAWNQGMIQTPKGPYEAVAVGGEISQVVVGGWTNAQVALAAQA